MKILNQLSRALALSLAFIFLISFARANEPVKPSGRTVVAEVVAFDQPFMLNRLGSYMNTPRIFALRKDVMKTDGTALPPYKDNNNLTGFAGQVCLKEYKRARPIVLRANVGDILEIRFTNLLADQASGQFAGCHVMGLSLEKSIDSDSSWVGKNNLTSNASPSPVGGSFALNANLPSSSTRIYRYQVDAEGVFILYSAADPTGNNGTLTEMGNGLFGCVIVQPPDAEYYRSQVLRTDLIDATYHSRNLPANMVLRLRPRLPGENENEQHWLLTTYRTRLHDFVVKNVDVIIGDAEKIQELTGPVQQADLKTNFLERVIETGESKKTPKLLKSAQDPKTRQLAEQGTLVPEGYLYSLETRHPLIDYGIAYTDKEKHRAAGSPVLEMLYPEAIKILAASKQSAELGNSNDPKVYKLQQNDKDKYRSAITQLDTGIVPRELWPVLNAWGIQEMPSITRVGRQRDYFDGGLKEGERISRAGTANYIWLLTGVTVSGQQNSSVIIHGDGGALTLHFVQAELQLFHSDLTAIITGPQAEGFGHMQESPSAFLIPASPERAQPYREFALGYHNGGSVTQAFAKSIASPLNSILGNGNDNFGINYGMAGISTEILANRLGVGPEGINKDGVDLKFEEFFLSSWAVGDPAMLVDRPANGVPAPTPCNASPTASPSGTPTPAPSNRATKVFYADDPSNVYHSYMRDHVKMRIYNAGESAPHVHHLHAHQWLRTQNSDEASYLDSQLIVPGSAFSLEITYNGSGNRNQTVGDSIFHCHFYPHFAQGMWSLWRVHDVFEQGTPLDPDGKVVSDPNRWVRALPDGEIATGVPIPAIVPLPTLAMPPIPPPVRVAQIPDLPANPAGGAASLPDLQKWVNISKDKKNPSMGRMAEVKPDGFAADGKPQFSNPGYPFFVPGVAGHRPPHPPLDMGWEEKDGVPDLLPNGEKKFLDGGLPRHQVLGGQIVREFHTQWDFTKDYIRYDEHEKPVDGAIVAYRVPEEGTAIEKAAMNAHRTRTVRTVQPDGRQGNFIHNGLAPVSGAPFADPGVDDEGNAVRSLRKYKAAVIQKDVVFNKAGSHYPQQRFITLWQDVKPTFDEKRPVQPFFFRANSGETVEYWHTNLVPEYYELDDFQVRTPTDIIGQHIHLVKFDVLASDGAVNGFNYEDGTISPDDVRGRIYAITRPSFASNAPGAKYSLFELSQPQAGQKNYVAGVDWSHFVAKTPVPTAWKGSYLQNEMSQGEAGKANPLVPPASQNWDGAMTTIQRFSTDPLLNDQGIDRTVRTVFTHDHFGPSTHQQAGLYAGFLVEPEKSVWRDPVTGGILYDPVTRTDGGPTDWEAIIEPQNSAESYREFALEFQDLQLAYPSNGGNAFRPMTGVPLKTPIKATGMTQLPVPGTKVNTIMLNGVSLTDYLRPYGISLTPDAVISALPTPAATPTATPAPAVGIVDNGPNSLYVYKPGDAAFSLVGATNPQLNFLQLKTWASPNAVINSPGKTQLAPTIVSGGGGLVGTYSVNYRNEPIWPAGSGSRVGPSGTGPQPQNDEGYAFASIDGRAAPWNIDRPYVTAPAPGPSVSPVPSLFARPKDPANINGAWFDPVGYATGQNGTNDGKISNWDPYTPLLRAYEEDKVQIRTLVGAHTQPHSFSLHGVKWLGEMKSHNSGYRNAQEMGISEHFEFEFTVPPASTDNTRAFADFLYMPSSGARGLENGLWGIMRSYDNPPKGDSLEAPVTSLRRIPKAANPRPYASHPPIVVKHPVDPDVEYSISAHSTPIPYNSNDPTFQNAHGLVYKVDHVRAKRDGVFKDLTGVTTKAGDPLILRANAGNWVKVILKNAIPAPSPGSTPSLTVGLHADLVAYDMSNADGANVGFNPNQVLTVGAGGSQEYWWYAGDLEINNGEVTAHPRELGAVSLCPAAPVIQDGYGLLGALIVEPADSNWAPPDYVSQQANIYSSEKDKQGKLLFHDFVLIEQTNITATNTAGTVSASSAVNNTSEDLGFRLGVNLGDLPTPTPSPLPFYQVLSNSLPSPPYFKSPGTPIGDPKTPIFTATAGDPVRFRVLQPGGDSVGGNIMFEIHGHSWQQEPWTNSSSALGNNPKSNVFGADILVPHKALNILINSAGGPDKVPGDYLYYSFLAGDGAWGIFRVTPPAP
jgi:hypothetical protein